MEVRCCLLSRHSKEYTKGATTIALYGMKTSEEDRE